MAAATWKAKLGEAIRADWGREIDVFETQLELKKQGRIEDKMFAETRLRRGAYGQRYDNGQRSDGERERELVFPTALTKGPMTLWDAPGMQRIKIPFGKLSAEQLEVLSDLAEEYSDSILHVTTRQDFQLHYVHIEDTPDLMRRLAAVGITTREACGNSVRNVTACPYAGVCHTESFDVAPYAHAITHFLLGHDDVQDFGRKFKPAFSGCKDEACGLVNFHDMGVVAKTRVVDGKTERGFEYWVGGGLGAVPQMAQLLSEFVSEAELLPVTQAVCRVFARLGEKENRARARIKFLIKKIGIEEFRRLVAEERQKLRPDPRWTEFLASLAVTDEQPLKPGGPAPAGAAPPGYAAWAESNVEPQKQDGYFTAKVTLPLGDLSSDQGRRLADVARRFVGDALRTTVDQNLLFRWVPGPDLHALYGALVEIGLADAGADTITDLTSCPGTDTCKLGISSSRGLARQLRHHLTVMSESLAPAARELHVKCSGCFNSCGQHHVADIGFLGVSRNVGGRRVPHFQLVVGGEWTHNGGQYGLAIGAVPSKSVPALLTRLTDTFASERQAGETFGAFVTRIGKKRVRALLEEYNHVPPYEEDPSYYSDWGDPREYTIGDMGVGECAGEVVPFIEMELAAAEREVFEGQVQLEEGSAVTARNHAFAAMVAAARALVKREHPNVGTDADEVVREFRTRFHDSKRFHDPFAGPKFAQYFFRAHEHLVEAATADGARQLVEEASLFVEAAHQCYQRLLKSEAAS